MKRKLPAKLTLAIVTSLLITANAYSAGRSFSEVKSTVDQVILPILKEHQIPGMAIGVTIDGESYFYSYGYASKEEKKEVTKETIFELGSVSKTFNATLGAYAQATGLLSLTDKASKYLPALSGSSFDRISMLNLVTYTAGGLPLQIPDDVDSQDKMVAYFKNWQPQYNPGEYRQYSNPSIGLFGYLTAKSMNGDYKNLVEKTIFEKLGLQNTFITVPPEKMQYYAWGYSKQDKPIRVNPGMLDAEAYGVKSSAEDMIKFVEANMNSADSHENLHKAINATHTGYFSVGEMTQGLGWELYSYPVTLEQLQAGNSARVAYEANKAVKLTPPRSLENNVFINKTGSTNGFGAYVAFVPGKKVGIVMLANKNYPNPVRIEAAYKILSSLE